MGDEIAIRVNNLGKCYHIYDRPSDRLRQLFSRGGKRYYREFWALHDVSFEVKKGEAFGIIGRNGSGKSTLLQLICGTLTPTIGEVGIHGKIAALLELGSGFNPEFTGRENVYINGAILGFSSQEIDNRFDEIAAFADIGDFIDQPVKTYSSGMYVRLAFAVQVCVEPDILVIDEALAVGDIFFQQKCFQRMRELREKGTTLIFVSHDMSVIRDLCDKSVYLNHGKVSFCGSSLEAINYYFKEGNTINVNSRDSSPIIINDKIKEDGASLDEKIVLFKNSAYWVNNQVLDQKTATNEGNIIAVSILDKNNLPLSNIIMGSEFVIKVLYQVYTSQLIHVNIVFKNRHNQVIATCNSYIGEMQMLNLQAGDFAIFEAKIGCMIEAGLYSISVSLNQVLEQVNCGHIITTTPSIGPLTVTWDFEHKKAPFLGMFSLPCSMQFTSLDY